MRLVIGAGLDAGKVYCVSFNKLTNPAYDAAKGMRALAVTTYASKYQNYNTAYSGCNAKHNDPLDDNKAFGSLVVVKAAEALTMTSKAYETSKPALGATSKLTLKLTNQLLVPIKEQSMN